MTGIEWIPLLEAARMVARVLSGSGSDDFDAATRRRAAGLLLQSLRTGKLDSEGWRDAGPRSRLTAGDWAGLKAEIDFDRLVPARPSLRRIQSDRIVGIVVNAAGLQQLLADREVTPLAPPQASKAQPKVPSAAEAIRILKDLRKLTKPHFPTNDEDAAAIREHYPEAPRSHYRKARETLTPTGGYKPGPRPAAEK